MAAVNIQGSGAIMWVKSFGIAESDFVKEYLPSVINNVGKKILFLWHMSFTFSGRNACSSASLVMKVDTLSYGMKILNEE